MTLIETAFKIEDKILSDSCEALIGAIFLDSNIETVEKIILYIEKNTVRGPYLNMSYIKQL